MNNAPSRGRKAVGTLAAGLAALLSLTVFTGLTDVASAKGSGKPPHNTPATATLLAPATAGIGQSFHISGAGYTPGQQAWILVETAGARAWVSASVDASGALSADDTLWEAGPAKLTASQTVALASTTITIG